MKLMRCCRTSLTEGGGILGDGQAGWLWYASRSDVTCVTGSNAACLARPDIRDCQNRHPNFDIQGLGLILAAQLEHLRDMGALIDVNGADRS